jgi:hypothetical protein
MSRWYNTDGLRKHAKAQRDETQKSRGSKRKKIKAACPHQFIDDRTRICCACGALAGEPNPPKR